MQLYSDALSLLALYPAPSVPVPILISGVSPTAKQIHWEEKYQ
ncbi:MULTISPECIES: hypothetical protein [unclassified Rhizobium]|nr:MULTISPECIES: hypothetical protein [unclassified Rhizobium]MDH7807886.1 hypothetical protein [Rhizobium sp. AN67]MDQ4405690.1 hypothetical protein [Rhizobium sp. AN63]